MSDVPPTRPLPMQPERIGPQGRYRVRDQLGAGGMGVVLRAQDEVLGRDVAIKLLADNLAADPEARERFLREARAAAAIHDPRVVAVHDVGEHEGRPYLVMECVLGPSLAEVLATGGPLDSDDVADAAVDALAGLARAHEAGLLHRDVKPANLLRAVDGTVKVTDFGVAVAADAPNLTRVGFVMGTAAYLAPERRRGQPATVATDLWALGATLLELLTGHPPSDEADAVLADRDDEVPAGLTALLRALLHDDPDHRPSSALAALEVLATPTGAASSEPVDDPTAGTAVLPAVPDAAADDTRPVDEAPTATTPRAVTPAAGTPTAAPVGPQGRDGPPARWGRVAVGAGLLLLAVVVVQTFADDPAPTATFEVEVDLDDRPGSARDLADLLRERGEG